MFRNSDLDTVVSTVSPAPRANREPVRHLLFGSPSAVSRTIKSLHKLGYADPNEWSHPLPTGRPGEVMAVLTKHLLSE